MTRARYHLPSPSAQEILVLNPGREGTGAPLGPNPGCGAPAPPSPRSSPVQDSVRRLHVPVLHHHRPPHEAQVVRHGRAAAGRAGWDRAASGASPSFPPARDTAGSPGFRPSPALPAPLPVPSRRAPRKHGRDLPPRGALPLPQTSPCPRLALLRLPPAEGSRPGSPQTDPVQPLRARAGSD